MDIITLFIIIVLFLVFYHYMIKPPWRNLPPGPPILPIIGSLPFFGVDPDFRKSFGRMQTKYGNIWMAQLGVNRAVVLSGYDRIYDALVNHSLVFSGRPLDILVFTDFFKPAVGLAEGEAWQHGRSFLIKVLKDLGFSKKSMGDHILMEVNQLIEEISKHQNMEVNITKLLKKSISNVITQFAFSHRFEYDDPEFSRRLAYIDEFLANIGNDSPLNAFPYLKYLPGDIFKYKRTLSIAQTLTNMYQGWVDEHKEHLVETETPRDFIEAYLLEMERQEKGENKFNNDHLVAYIAELFLAASDTISMTLGWALLYIMLDPQVQAKIHQEIDTVIGQDRLPTLKDKKNMPYFEACLSESQRLATTVPLGLPHCNLEEVELGGYTIPKRTMIILNMHSVFMDPDTWHHPSTFDPERFLDADGRYRKGPEFIPFSLGPRSCPGESLARMELFLFLVSLLQRFSLHIPDGQPPPSTTGTLGITHAPRPYTALFKQR